MLAPLVIAIAVVAILAGLAVLWAEALWIRRRRVLRRRFGTEFDRVLADSKSRRKTVAELAERERRVAGLNIRPLAAPQRASYVSRWAGIQEGFVDQPDSAVGAARQLVTELISDRGYATQDHDQLLADLSVGHASSVGHYRSARGLSDSTSGVVSTENLRQALIHYRSMLEDLAGKPAEHGKVGAAEEVGAAGELGAAEEVGAADGESAAGEERAVEEERADQRSAADQASNLRNG